jgi:hypothetical protein
MIGKEGAGGSLLLPDLIKKCLLSLNRFQGALERNGVITYQDRIRLRGPSYRRRLLLDQEGNDHIAKLLSGSQPLLVSRLGGVEMNCLRVFLARRDGKRVGYSEKIRRTMACNAGFFPTDDRSLDAFAALHLESLGQADAMGIWFYKHEDLFCNTYCGGASLVDSICLEPFRFGDPWSSKLEGKRVLVVHPFDQSIRIQYREKRDLLFPGTAVLPDFELKVIRAVQSIAGCPVGFTTWFDAYRHMCGEIARVDFDICLIGAGAYGLPLAAFVKKLGKQALHLGGVTQILFGIKGRRWEREYADSTATLFNEHWVRPLPSETPADKEKVERGCYW